MYVSSADVSATPLQCCSMCWPMRFVYIIIIINYYFYFYYYIYT